MLSHGPDHDLGLPRETITPDWIGDRHPEPGAIKTTVEWAAMLWARPLTEVAREASDPRDRALASRVIAFIAGLPPDPLHRPQALRVSGPWDHVRADLWGALSDAASRDRGTRDGRTRGARTTNAQRRHEGRERAGQIIDVARKVQADGKKRGARTLARAVEAAMKEHPPEHPPGLPSVDAIRRVLSRQTPTS